MSKKDEEQQKPGPDNREDVAKKSSANEIANGDADGVADTGEVEGNGHDEAAEILTNLLQNQSLTSANNAAAAAGGAAVVEAANVAAGGGGNTQVAEAQQAAIQQMMLQLKLGGVPGAENEGERKHAFWDTQVRRISRHQRMFLCRWSLVGSGLTIRTKRRMVPYPVLGC